MNRHGRADQDRIMAELKDARRAHARYWRLSLVLLVVAFGGTASVLADEIWGAANLLADRPILKNDLVTVIRPVKAQKAKPINGDEKNKTTPTSKTGSDKNADALAQVDLLPERLTTRVIQVLPNGNLVLEGRRETRMKRKIKTVVFLGEVRAREVTEKRTVRFDRISGVKVSVSVRDEPAPAKSARARRRGR